jgi:protein phosphatase 2C family protein 2/3
MYADQKEPSHDRSGSCAIIVLMVDNECYVANVGDSRAIMSADDGKKLFLLSRDHRPDESHE